jgi:anti-anti-sigma factor
MRPMPPFEIYEPTGRLLSAVNRCDIHDRIEAALKAGARFILLDLRNMMFMDSQGLGTLMSAWNRSEAAGAKLVLCSLNGQARMLLERSGTDQVFTIFQDRTEFMSFLQNPNPDPKLNQSQPAA